MKYTFLKPLLFIVFLASLFLTSSNSVNGQGFFQSQQNTDKQNVFKDEQQQDIQTGQESKDNNLNYIKYQNKPIGFEIQYPKDWDLSKRNIDTSIILSPFSSPDSSLSFYYFDHDLFLNEFNELTDYVDKQSNILKLGIEPIFGINMSNSIFDKFMLGDILFLRDNSYEYVIPFKVDGHNAYKIIYPYFIHIPIETFPDIPTEIFNIYIIVDNTKEIDESLKNQIDKIISSIKFSNPQVIDTSISLGSQFVKIGDKQNITIYSTDKYANEPLPFTNVTFKITYPSGFVLDVPTPLTTNEFGKIFYEWVIPNNNDLLGEYYISINSEKENYTSSSASNYFYVLENTYGIEYTESEWGIKFQVQDPWTITSNSEKDNKLCNDELKCLIVLDNTLEDQLSTITILAEKGQEFENKCQCDSLLEFVQYDYNKTYGSLDDFSLINNNQTTLNENISAWQMEYSDTVIDRLILWTTNNNIFYKISYHGNEDTYSKYLPSIKEFINSITFVKPEKEQNQQK